MDKQKTGGTAKFRATVTILGIWVLGAMVLWSSGCNRTEYGQFSPQDEGLFLAGVRPASGDSARLLRNAHYLKLMGRPEMALKELEAARQQDPHNLRVLDTLARTYEERGDFIQAQKIYQEALALDGSNQALNNNLCFSYYLTGQWEKAESCFRQALAKNPQNITVRNNLGLLLCRSGRQEEARRLWQEAEGEIAAQKKMQQVMVALGLGDPAHYAQRPQPAPSPSPSPAASTPVKKPLTTAKATLPAASPPPPPESAAPASKAREPEKLATKPVPAAVQRDKKPAPPATVLRPTPQPARELTVAAKAESAPAAPKAQAKPAPVAVPAKPAPKVLAAAQPQTAPQPAPPKQAAEPEKKPVPATTPPPQPKQLKPRLAKESAPVTTGKPEKTAKFAKPGIELLNGSGAKNMARKTRTRLSGEGFKVVSIGNYRDFGADQTVIYYRPGAEDAARDLSTQFFPNSRLETGEKFAKNADIKVLLGKDLLAPPALAREPAPLAEKIAAETAPSQAELKPAALSTADSPSAATAQTPASPPLLAPAAAEAKPEVQANTPRPYLTAAELGNTAIDLRNGSGAKNLAHKARSMLSQEGFYVAHIGNHWDFGAEKTVIYYRPDAEKVARNLGNRFFPHCQLEQSARLPKGMAVKVLLGKDLLQRDDVMANLSN
ncbi:MAG: hypothetical protein A2Z73_06185 [Deltaproteobacteria bacterium RBG_13_60_28]|nr:MAG: hypothetical protein A2Z73_06185 [Deltaproteobacteria bacterium RBG_13_60_28]